MNVGIISMVALLFAGCTLFPVRNKSNDSMYAEDQAETQDQIPGEASNEEVPETLEEMTNDNSLEQIESDLDSTNVDELNVETDTQLEDSMQKVEN